MCQPELVLPESHCVSCLYFWLLNSPVFKSLSFSLVISSPNSVSSADSIDITFKVIVVLNTGQKIYWSLTRYHITGSCIGCQYFHVFLIWDNRNLFCWYTYSIFVNNGKESDKHFQENERWNIDSHCLLLPNCFILIVIYITLKCLNWGILRQLSADLHFTANYQHNYFLK